MFVWIDQIGWKSGSDSTAAVGFTATRPSRQPTGIMYANEKQGPSWSNPKSNPSRVDTPIIAIKIRNGQNNCGDAIVGMFRNLWSLFQTVKASCFARNVPTNLDRANIWRPKAQGQSTYVKFLSMLRNNVFPWNITYTCANTGKIVNECIFLFCPA